MNVKWMCFFTLFFVTKIRADFFNDPQGVLRYAGTSTSDQQKPVRDYHSQSYVLPPSVGVGAMVLGMGMSAIAKTGRAASRLVTHTQPLVGAGRLYSVACFPHDKIDDLAQLEDLMRSPLKRWLLLPIVQWWNDIPQQQINDIQECHDDGINAAEQIKRWQMRFAKLHIQKPVAIAAKVTLVAAKIADLFLRPLRSVCARSSNLFDGIQVQGQRIKAFGHHVLNQIPPADESVWSANF